MANGAMTRYFIVMFNLYMALLLPAAAQAAIVGLTVESADNGSELLKFKATRQVEIKKYFSLSRPDRLVVDIARSDASGVVLPQSYRGRLLKAVRFGQFDGATSRIVLDVAVPSRIVATQGGALFTVEIAPLEKAKPKPLVVIDAGHGGQDPGATGLHKTIEKEVTLNYARGLKDALLATGRYRVALTRDDDRFILLQDRVAVARRLGGDIFLSFHADSNPRPAARGFSIYTLSETASDDEAAALAERENKSDIIPGIDLNTTDADVANILIDLTQRETMNKSAQMADAVVAALHGKVIRLEKTHRFAGFRVLKAPDIPSVLIELGFLSNEADERLLLTPEYRDLLIASVVKGIDRFQAAEQGLSR